MGHNPLNFSASDCWLGTSAALVLLFLDLAALLDEKKRIGEAKNMIECREIPFESLLELDSFACIHCFVFRLSGCSRKLYSFDCCGPRLEELYL